MAVSGNLETMELSELLQWVALSSKTGTLVIEREQGEKRIYFEDGSIIATASSEGADQLGQYLVSRGLLDEEQLTQALDVQQSTDMRLGMAVVTMGLVTEAEVHRALVEKAEECVFEIFVQPQGAFRFEEEQPLEGVMVPLLLDVTALVLKAAEMSDEWNRINKIIPSNDCVPVSVGFLDAGDLPAEAQGILAQVDDDRSIDEICAATHSSELSVKRVLYSMLQNGKLKIVRPRIAGDAAPVPSIRASNHLEIAQHLIADGNFGHATRHLAAARSLDPHGRDTTKAIDREEERIARVLDREGVELQAVPTLSIDAEHVQELRLSPEEGFVMSRIDGSYDIESILKISPMPALEARLVFRKLLKAGHISLERPKE